MGLGVNTLYLLVTRNAGKKRAYSTYTLYSKVAMMSTNSASDLEMLYHMG
jgi:hypothetical protein